MSGKAATDTRERRKAGPKRAMVLAAGLGTRLRPITLTTPKPLVQVAGRSLLDRGLDQLERAGVTLAIANVHHLPDQIIAHCAQRKRPRVLISDERDGLLDSGGGIVAALPRLGRRAFFILNADTFWIDPDGVELARMVDIWSPRRMDMLLMLVEPGNAIGHSGGGDFLIDQDGRLTRAKGEARATAPIYAGVIIARPSLFDAAPAGPHSLNLHFDRLISQGRLFGHVMTSPWITVGTPEGLAEAESAVQRLRRERQSD
ncbi:MAG: nucleotidyltransferase family protein [Rhizobiaceae bacterium]|nr:nucleotidyltransferase family protein [Rhizobiaceae bacterium]